MNMIPASDEEDDIESLRIAALQSLKKKPSFPNVSPGHSPSDFFRAFKGSRSKWGRFGPQGRVAKSGHFNNRIRSTNLISITPISDDPKPEAKFCLSQNKCEDVSKHVVYEEGSSKFNRYNKSDKSESESEETTELEDEASGKLKKSDSLEALMQELDDEIQGKSKTNKDISAMDMENQKNKKNKKGKTSEKHLIDSKAAIDISEKQVQSVIEDIDNSSVDKNKIVPASEDPDALPKVFPEHNFQKADITGNAVRMCLRSRSPFRRIPFHRRQNQHYPEITSQPHLPFIPMGNFQPQLPFMNPRSNPLFVQSGFNMPPRFPSYFDRPLSPLAINTQSLTTATMAPLSPRSAAFVLQNKAIIEKRRRSPRRSYSRSPSRSLSRSPRRSLTPLRRSLTPLRRSLTPLRRSITPPRRFRRSVSPRRSSRSPRRFSSRKRSLSPIRRSVTPKRKLPSGNLLRSRPPIHDRLGLKSDIPEDKPKEKEFKEVLNKETLDPVLAARKKKFESNELKKKEGIIRLKPKEQTSEIANIDEAITASLLKPIETKTSVVISKPVKSEEFLTTREEITVAVTPSDGPKNKQDEDKSKDPDEFKELERLLNDDNALEDLLLDHKVGDIFSDDESASDNEGRFKAKVKQGEKVPVLSFSKLVNGVKQERKAEALPDYSRNTRERDRNRYESKLRIQPLSHSKEIEQEEKINKSVERQSVRQKITLKTEASTTRPVERRQERKIEIRIKNPSKYEKTTKMKPNKPESEVTEQKIVIPIQGEPSEDRYNEDLIIEGTNDSVDEENIVLTEGDLRTQLSRKRAEKRHKLPAEEVSSRILQYALQGAIFKKSKKKSKRKSLTSVSDAKLPIHFRLGISNPQDFTEDIKVKKKKKRKTRDLLEQV